MPCAPRACRDAAAFIARRACPGGLAHERRRRDALARRRRCADGALAHGVDPCRAHRGPIVRPSVVAPPVRCLVADVRVVVRGRDVGPRMPHQVDALGVCRAVGDAHASDGRACSLAQRAGGGSQWRAERTREHRRRSAPTHAAVRCSAPRDWRAARSHAACHLCAPDAAALDHERR